MTEHELERQKKLTAAAERRVTWGAAMTREWWNALACFAGCGLCVLLAAALVPRPAPERPPLPDALEGAAWLSPRVDLLAAELTRSRRILRAQRELMLARTKRERREAARAAVVAWGEP